MALGDASGGVLADARELLARLDGLRETQSKLDALLLLHEARQQVEVARLRAVERVDRLTRELAQLEAES